MQNCKSRVYNIERNEIIYNRYIHQGHSMKEIASEFSICITRVHTIIKKHKKSCANLLGYTESEKAKAVASGVSDLKEKADKRKPKPARPETIDAIMRLLIEF